MRRLPALLLLGLGACAVAPLPVAPGTPAPDAPPRFILLADTQETMALEFWRQSHDRERQAVIRAVADERPAFVVHGGDVVCHGGRREDWRKFCEENEPVFSRGIAYFPALGNHDYYLYRKDALDYRAEVFPHVGHRRWYEVRFDPVLIGVLDSNFDELTAEQVRDQDAWLDKLLAAAETDAAVRHVILVCHHPPYTNAHGLSDSREVQDHFVARLTPKVKVFFSGHVHNYERFRKREVHYLVSGGAGGPTRTVETDKPRHEPLYAGPRTRPFHYCRFTVGDGTLRCDVMMLQDDGSWKRVDGFDCP
jgi:predicted MPP superfamily phosphohydrolase